MLCFRHLINFFTDKIDSYIDCGNGRICHLTASLLDEVTTVLDVKQQICIGMILNTDSLIDEQLREHILHPEGHIQDVRDLRRRRRGSLYLSNPRVKMNMTATAAGFSASTSFYSFFTGF